MYLFFLNSFYRVARERSETAADGAERRPKNPANGVFFRNYPEGRNVFLPSTFNAGLRDGSGFPMSPFRLIGLFWLFPGAAIPDQRT
jgi:hypothetical protein